MPSPVLNEGELESLLKDSHLKPHVLPTFFDVGKGVDGSLKRSLYKLCEAADEAVRNGSQLLVLSDRFDELVSSLLAIFMLLSAFLFQWWIVCVVYWHFGQVLSFSILSHF